MNVLLVYPELPFSFWSYSMVTKITSVKAIIAPLGPITVAALLPKNWNIKFVDLNIRKITEKEWRWSDIVMLSGMIIQRSGFKTIVEEAKKKSKLVIAGGPYPTLMADELIAFGCDFVVKGEAENSIGPLLDAIQSGQTGQIITCREYPDLSTTPIPRYDLIRTSDYRSFLVQTTRGCPFSCEFCNIEALNGKKPRFKSPVQVVAELEHLFQLGARGDIVIADDNFIANKENAKAICQEMIIWNRHRRQPFGFSTQASVNLGQDMEMIDLMTAANFGEVFIGIESPDEEVLKANEKYQNVVNPLVESIENIKRNGLSVIGSFIVGFDSEKKGAGKRICDFVDRTHIPVVMPNILFAPPGTKLKDRLEREGRYLEEDTNLRFCDSVSHLPNFISTRPIEEIVEEYVGIWEYLYDPSRFLERTYKFCLAVRPTRKAMAEKSGEQPAIKLAKTRRGRLRNLSCDIILFLYHMLNHGVISAHRVQFWKQLYGMYKNNPSRLRKYCIHCVSGEQHFRTSKTIRSELYSMLAERREKVRNT